MVDSAREALRSLWKGRADVYIKKMVINPENGRNEATEERILKAEPCRLSYKSVTSVNPVEGASVIEQVIKLFISETVQIPPGSKIIVTQNDVTKAFSRSGEPAYYTNHQEIVLKPFERWA